MPPSAPQRAQRGRRRDSRATGTWRAPLPADFDRATIPCEPRRFPLESPGRDEVLPESPRTRGAEGATRPETLRHPNGRNLRSLESGPRGPTEGERNRVVPVPNLSGFRTEG